jgi:hypothetical protein
MYSSTCFGRPYAHHKELNNCSSSLWFYRWSGDSSAVGRGRAGSSGPTTTNSTELLINVYRVRILDPFVHHVATEINVCAWPYVTVSWNMTRNLVDRHQRVKGICGL